MGLRVGKLDFLNKSWYEIVYDWILFCSRFRFAAISVPHTPEWSLWQSYEQSARPEKISSHECADDAPLSRIQACARSASLKHLRGNYNFEAVFCACSASVALAKCLELLLFQLYFNLLMKKLWPWSYILRRSLRFELGCWWVITNTLGCRDTSQVA